MTNNEVNVDLRCLGNSGGPVFDADTGEVVGHTVSTQDAVSEATINAIEEWERKYLGKSQNYKRITVVIQPHLKEKKPNDSSYRVHPKFFRTLSGDPSGGALFKNTTFICPGDLGPNLMEQRPDEYNAVFNRHWWDSPDVLFRNLTGRIDRIDLSTKSLGLIAEKHPDSTLCLTMFGRRDKFSKPSLVTIIAKRKAWKVPIMRCHQKTTYTSSTVIYSFCINLGNQSHIGTTPPNKDFSLADWTQIELEQSGKHFPERVNIGCIIRKSAFPFSVDTRWPPDRPDVTANAQDVSLEWPAETFRFLTTVGLSNIPTQKEVSWPPQPTTRAVGGKFIWAAPIDRVWTGPLMSLTNDK